MSSCAFTALARQDLSDIHEHIALDSPTRALAQVEKIVAACEKLALMPALGRARDELFPGWRSFPVAQYVAFYRRTAPGIEVLRVLHGARDLDALFP